MCAGWKNKYIEENLCITLVIHQESEENYGTARQDTDYNSMRRMRIACWINKATDKHSEYVILTAFLREQWLGKSAWILHQYVHCRLVILYIIILYIYCTIT